MAAKLMRAVQYSSYGGGAAALEAEKRDCEHDVVPVPCPAKDEVLVKLEAASLNPVDWKVQEGVLRPLFPRKFPHIPVVDVAGEVVEVGSGVKDFKAGDKVVSSLGTFNGGGLAEYFVAKECLTVSRPAEVSAADGAGLPIAALTAHQALTEVAAINLDGTGPRKTILITAASGGVGHYAVQPARQEIRCRDSLCDQHSLVDLRAELEHERKGDRYKS